MTLMDYKIVGKYSGFCYEKVVKELNLEEEFESVTGESVDEYEYEPSKLGEDELIHRVLEVADEKYVLYSDVVEYNERMYYAILSLKA